MVLLVTRSLPTLPRQAGPAARRALHGVAGRRVMTSRPALAQLSRQSGVTPASCPGPATTTLRGSTPIRLMSSAKREKVKVLAVLYDGGKHAEEVCFFPLSIPLSSPFSQAMELLELQALETPCIEMRGTTRHPMSALRAGKRANSPSQLQQTPNGSWLCRGLLGVATACRRVTPLPPCPYPLIPLPHGTRFGETRTLTPTLTGPRTSRNHPERAWPPQMARGAGPHPGHHLRQGRRELDL